MHRGGQGVISVRRFWGISEPVSSKLETWKACSPIGGAFCEGRGGGGGHRTEAESRQGSVQQDEVAQKTFVKDQFGLSLF